MTTIIVLLLTAILTSSIYNIITLRRQAKHLKEDSILNDAKYYELKYRIEFITTIVPIIIVFLGIMGYKEFDGISSKIDEEVTKQVKPRLDSLNNQFDSLNKQFVTVQQRQQNVNKGIDTSSQSLTEIENKTKSIEEKINKINDKDILKAGTYIVNGLDFRSRDSIVRYEFSNLKTIDNKGLPAFSYAPKLMVSASTGENFRIVKVTNTYFIIGRPINPTYAIFADGNNPNYPKIIKMDVWIADYKTN